MSTVFRTSVFSTLKLLNNIQKSPFGDVEKYELLVDQNGWIKLLAKCEKQDKFIFTGAARLQVSFVHFQ